MAAWSRSMRMLFRHARSCKLSHGRSVDWQQTRGLIMYRTRLKGRRTPARACFKVEASGSSIHFSIEQHNGEAQLCFGMQSLCEIERNGEKRWRGCRLVPEEESHPAPRAECQSLRAPNVCRRDLTDFRSPPHRPLPPSHPPSNSCSSLSFTTTDPGFSTHSGL